MGTQKKTASLKNRHLLPMGRIKLKPLFLSDPRLRTMNRHRYVQIVRGHMLPWAGEVFGRNFVFVQNNSPPVPDTVASLEPHDVEVMDWQAMTSYMSLIGHVWNQMSI